jgi:hypothetical protein
VYSLLSLTHRPETEHRIIALVVVWVSRISGVSRVSRVSRASRKSREKFVGLSM